ncbi:MAG: LL-diaminopimelate aminotransferase [Eubacteriales bacterium]|nr:LL-diaminopimelate aminotransferase [Eubacteriales bacterium]
MFTANGDYSLLEGNYLFYEIGKRAREYQAANPDSDIIRMGIGDVTRPLVPAVIDAMHRAVDEMGSEKTFHGYGPDFGYDFLREAILRRDYTARGAGISVDEIFISDGAKCDVGNIQELFSRDCIVGIMDPVYPVYLDTNVMGGRSGRFSPKRNGYERIVYLPATESNGFVPDLPKERVDVLYLCYPNNPTGMTLSHSQLRVFVDWANETGALLLYDSAYESYITDENVPHSIFEIEGAQTCAIEFRSMSKTAGFTGTRCAYTVVPKALVRLDSFGNKVSLYDMWARRVSTKFNGVSYITQVGAAAAYNEGYEQIKDVVAYYMENARIIREGMESAGYTCFGGINAPYVWIKVPHGDSWRFFDELLKERNIIGTPGAGFGASGEGYFRMTAFASRENTLSAMKRMEK